MSEASIFCSFCGKHKDYVDILIAGPKVYICAECVDLASVVVNDHRAKRAIAEQESEDIADV